MQTVHKKQGEYTTQSRKNSKNRLPVVEIAANFAEDDGMWRTRTVTSSPSRRSTTVNPIQYRAQPKTAERGRHAPDTDDRRGLFFWWLEWTTTGNAAEGCVS